MGKTLGLICCLLLSLGFNVFALYYYSQKNDEVHTAEAFEAAQQKYPLISKRVLMELPQDIHINFLKLRNDLRDHVKGYGDDFGFYFEYIPNGNSIGVNSNDEFHAASLFKVPVIMAYYHLKERMKLHDDPYLTLKKEDIDNEFGELWKKGAGYKIKSSEAIRLALIESDNTAAKALAGYVTDEDFNAVYKSLDIELHTDTKGALVSTRNYSSVLKALYYSSVLTKESSNEILDMLSKSKFNDKLVAGVPDKVIVSHKIGNFKDKDGKEGFRDCGIVYVPRRPYLLCMFSVGDEQTASDRMQAVSKRVYDYVTSETENQIP